jgi:hypothetical protein
MTMVCEVLRIARSSVYAAADASDDTKTVASTVLFQKRGPKTRETDTELVKEIRAVLKASSFVSEGHRKVRAMLRKKGVRVVRHVCCD